jgi:hypothetical protein
MIADYRLRIGGSQFRKALLTIANKPTPSSELARDNRQTAMNQDLLSPYLGVNMPPS